MAMPIIHTYDPPILVDTPAGPAFCDFVVDYSMQQCFYYHCWIRETGEPWTFANTLVRLHPCWTTKVRVAECQAPGGVAQGADGRGAATLAAGVVGPLYRVATVGAGSSNGGSGGSAAAARDGRDPDHSKTGMFVLHRCGRCEDGARPCVQGNPAQCDWPVARNH